MTITVTMLQTRRGEDGNLWTVAGSPYEASLDFAYYLIGNAFATGTLPTSMQSYPVTQLVATAAEIAALTGQPGVLYVERDGAKRMFRWNNSAMQEVGAGAGASGGGGGGGGSDRTAVITEADSVNGGKRVLTETVDGIPHTYGYDVFGRLITDVWTIGGLSRAITYDADGFGTASGNIYRDSSIVVTVSQMATLKTQLTALALTTLTPRFYVSDFNGSRGLLVEWNGTDACFRPAAGGEVVVGDSITAYASAVPAGATELTTGYSVVTPAWLRGPRGAHRVEFLGNYGANEADQKTTRIKLNGTMVYAYTILATQNAAQMDVQVDSVGATDFAPMVSTAGVGSGMTGTSSAELPANTTIAAGTDLTWIVTMQFDTGGTGSSAATGKMFRVSYRHP